MRTHGLVRSFSKICVSAARQIGCVCRTISHRDFFNPGRGPNGNHICLLPEFPCIKCLLRLSSANTSLVEEKRTCRAITSDTHPLAHRTFCSLWNLVVHAQIKSISSSCRASRCLHRAGRPIPACAMVRFRRESTRLFLKHGMLHIRETLILCTASILSSSLINYGDAWCIHTRLDHTRKRTTTSVVLVTLCCGPGPVLLVLCCLDCTLHTAMPSAQVCGMQSGALPDCSAANEREFIYDHCESVALIKHFHAHAATRLAVALVVIVNVAAHKSSL